MSLEPGLSVIVPVFRSRDCLPHLYRRLVDALAPLGRPFEVILVEDDGQDGSWDRIEALAAADPRVRGIRLSRNFGQHNALLCGIRAAAREFAVTLDDDLQTPPEEIPRLLAKLDEGWDVVYGAPDRQQHGLLRDLASTVTKLVLQGAMGAATAGNSSAFRAFRTRLRAAFASFDAPYLSIDVLLTWGTTRFTHVTVRHDPRLAGASNYTLRKLIIHALNMVTGFSTLPLRVASWIGFAFTLFGMLVLAYVVGRYLLQGSTVAGFPFLASIIALFSGTQLFALGIIGEYLARVHQHALSKPAFVVATRTADGAGVAEGASSSGAGAPDREAWTPARTPRS